MKHLSIALALLTAPLAAQTCSGIALGVNGNLNGFRAFPGSPNATPITNAAVDPSNAAFQTEMGSISLHPNGGNGFGMSYTVVDTSTTPLLHLKNVQYEDPDSDKARYPFPPTIAVEDGMPPCPFDSGVGDGNDHHVIAIDRNKCAAYEAWIGSYCPNRGWKAANTAIWDLTINEQRPWGITSVDASGMSIFAGLIRYEEATTQTVPATLPNGTVVQTLGHAIRYTTNHWAQGGSPYGSFYTYPATHGAGGCCSAANGERNYAGQRIRMKPGTDTSALTGYALVIANTMKTYGMTNQDRGSDGYFDIANDPRWDNTQLDKLKLFHFSDFELTLMGPIYTDSTAPTGTAPTITGTPTLSRSVIVEGDSVTLTPAPATGASYQYFVEGPFFRAGDATVSDTPLTSTCYPQTARNAYGTAVSAPVCVTVLPIPFKGVTKLTGQK